MIIIEKEIRGHASHFSKMQHLDMCEVCRGRGKVVEHFDPSLYDGSRFNDYDVQCVNCDGTGFICSTCGGTYNSCCCSMWMFP